MSKKMKQTEGGGPKAAGRRRVTPNLTNKQVKEIDAVLQHEANRVDAVVLNSGHIAVVISWWAAPKDYQRHGAVIDRAAWYDVVERVAQMHLTSKGAK